MRVAVVIPAYEAATTIGDVVVRTRAALPDAVIIVVDDGSTDGTGEEARRKGPILVTHPRNRGKGVALRAGIARACAEGATIIVTLDADGQHPPEVAPQLVEPIARAEADVILGARHRSDVMPVPRRFTNWLSASLASRIGGQRVSDAQTGFRAFTRAVAERLRPAGDRYEYEANFLLDALQAGFTVTSIEVPTIYGVRSHFRAWSDSWRMARAFARHAGRIVVGAT